MPYPTLAVPAVSCRKSDRTYDIVQILQVTGVLRFPADEIPIYGSALFIVHFYPVYSTTLLFLGFP